MRCVAYKATDNKAVAAIVQTVRTEAVVICQGRKLSSQKPQK